MDEQAIESLLQERLPGCRLELTSEGNKLSLKIASEEFEGLNRVKRQQIIYALLDEKIKSGEIHAVSMVTQTPEEAGD
ncbi:MAG: BolA/IbaG family iron-sulfur metabolism protein [Gammaproteobacteria bacterium]|nr:BolA/IbaG family iron-sulfur metabolism protein [Gammaproteobacteria bacterium]MBT4494272.1 BolA/IbaG family iron-sulfur metabolism protein [Gammaproteobacteria bacterium]MBT7372271.1 BolA/IbaG family iron-sulfur metabolism protein [Gammaproteobacteria bacterium]